MTYNNILIVKLSAIGDVVHALPVAHALKKCYPKARITWVVEKPAYDLLTNNPDIDEIILFDKPKFKSFLGFLQYAPAFISLLRAKKFDLALDLQGLFKSGMIGLLSGAPERLVYENTREGSDKLSKRVVGQFAAGHVVERYLDVVRYLGCQVDKPVFTINITVEEAAKTQSIANHAGLKPGVSYIVLAPGANWPNKIWPTERYAALCDRIYDADLVPVVVGGPSDEFWFAEICANAHIPPVSLVGKTSLKQLAYVIQRARAFVSGDTGPMHLSVALGTPTVALMGPTDIIRNGPYGAGHKAIVVQRSCAGCWRRQCPDQLDCLAEISADEVFDALAEFFI